MPSFRFKGPPQNEDGITVYDSSRKSVHVPVDGVIETEDARLVANLKADGRFGPVIPLDKPSAVVSVAPEKLVKVTKKKADDAG